MIREYRDTTKPPFFSCYPFKKIFVHLRLVNLVLFYTMRNGSIVLGKSTLNLALPRLTKESTIIYICFIYISYSRRRAKAGIFNVHFEKN